ncbi:MAG: hypothetical protein Q9163_006181 [Psora crenata]
MRSRDMKSSNRTIRTLKHDLRTTIEAMYLNPPAAQWRSQYSINSAVLELHRKLPGYRQTPLRPLSQKLCDQLQVKHIFLKDESDRFGLPAFKILGASWASYRVVTTALGISFISSFQDVKAAAANANMKLYAATVGNFGRAVSRMAMLMGVTANIYVPMDMVEKTKELFASESTQVVVVQGDYGLAVKSAAERAKETGRLVVQDTASPGYEEIPQIDQQLQEAAGKMPDLLIVPVGVGSLAQAVVAHYKHKQPPLVILTLEPDTAACLKTSLENGQETTIATGNTNMCGMNSGTVASLAWPYLRDGVDASITVTDNEADDALKQLIDMQISTGPCSAGTLAALVKACRQDQDTLHLKPDSVVVLLGTE